MDIFFIFLDFLKLQVENNFFYSLFFITFFLLIYNSFSIPGNIIFIASTGYFFGIYIGFIISILTIVFGSLLFFIFSSYFLNKFSPNTIKKYSKQIDKYISNSSIEFLIIFRIIPGTPLMVQNLILSFLNISKLKFILSSFIGFSPLIFILVFFGDQLKSFENVKSFEITDIISFKFLIFILIIITILIIRIIYKKNKL